MGDLIDLAEDYDLCAACPECGSLEWCLILTRDAKGIQHLLCAGCGAVWKPEDETVVESET